MGGGNQALVLRRACRAFQHHTISPEPYFYFSRKKILTTYLDWLSLQGRNAEVAGLHHTQQELVPRDLKTKQCIAGAFAEALRSLEEYENLRKKSGEGWTTRPQKGQK